MKPQPVESAWAGPVRFMHVSDAFWGFCTLQTHWRAKRLILPISIEKGSPEYCSGLPF
ncbi:hypothetical protein HU147_12680 [Planomicrobium chinense]|uniref:hypothetical protein n=1 Tax=Planococcus chinensis TaxID=272917 RepID=UPI001CC3A59C|nr:hypothetical protein [Planococcus chinensis]MBZ5202074.1 hypothetical protein [Planococcus chinensis]